METGYDPDFIGDGIHIPLPTFSRRLGQSVLRDNALRKRIYSDHTHFTLVMNEHTRQLVYSAYNIDQSLFRPDPAGRGKRGWRNDPNIDRRFQLPNKYYANRRGALGEVVPNPYDKGHMVMRFNNMWGATNAESDRAGRDTFIYSNSSLQHENLNRDEWKELELNIVRKLRDDSNDRLAVFTGPIYGDLDRHVNLSDRDSARVPSGFFKVICYRRASALPNDALGVLAFAIFQDAEVLRDRRGSKLVKTNHSYQVTVSELQNWTGISFGRQLYDQNPLFYRDIAARNQRYNVNSIPERIPVTSADAVVSRARDLRPDVQHFSSRRIVINSAMIDPRSDERRNEWVSLHNRGTRRTRVEGWRLVDGAGRTVHLAGSIDSGESMRLKGPTLRPVRLSNAGGNLALHDSHDCLIDYVSWSRAQITRQREDVAFLFDSDSN